MFNLHSSADYAFVLTRHGLKQQPHSFTGSDEAVSWELVRIVKYLVPTATVDAKAGAAAAAAAMAAGCCCPICLDSYTCPRITKCGHVFCFPCLLRHIQVHAQTNPYTHVKCPCCAIPLHVPDLRPVRLKTLFPPKLHQRIKLVKLHRTKGCPSPYLPRIDAVQRSSSHAAPSMKDLDAPYCRFNYLDTATYQDHLAANKAELERTMADLFQQQETSQQKIGQLQQRQKEIRQEQQQHAHPITGRCTNNPQNAAAVNHQMKLLQQQQNFHTFQIQQTQVEVVFLTSSLDIVNKEILKAVQECSQEQEVAEAYAAAGSGVTQQQPQHLMACKYEFTQLPMGEGRFRGESIGSEGDPSGMLIGGGGGSIDTSSSPANRERHRSASIESEGENVVGRYRGDSIGSYHSAQASVDHAASLGGPSLSDAPLSPESQQSQGGRKGNNFKAKKQQEYPKASMYLEEEGSFHFYQCEDGQLCFLSRFNMNCLLSDFSPKLPDLESVQQQEEQQKLNYWQRRKLLPLPDFVEGEILEIETIHLTPDVRKKMPHLQHLPLYTDILFVELDLNNLLSMDTKRKFKADFEKRRKRRQGKVKAEKREDKLLKKKEEERINELKARMQQGIDPNDEFFQLSPPPEEPVALTGEAFGPTISGANQSTSARPMANAAAAVNNPAVSFANVIQSGGAFPALSVSAEANFPALGASPSSRSQPGPPVWGSPTRNKSVAANATANAPIPPVIPGGGLAPKQIEEAPKPGPPGPKKKGKGKKIVLFSTGGQRGGY